MNRIATLALVSTTVLFAACSKPTEAATQPPANANAPVPPASPADVPAAPAPQPGKVPESPTNKPVAAPVTPPAVPTMADLGKLLGSITDGPTAEAAKTQIEAVIQSLESTKKAATSGQLGSDLGKLAGAAAAKVGVDLAALKSAAMQQVTDLLARPAVKDAIGPTLDRLQSLLK